MKNTGMRITAAGIACLDHLVAAPTIPWGNTAEVASYSVQGGGLAATALVACARLGAEARMISMVGLDPTGDQILQGLQSENINTDLVWRVEGGASPFSFIHVDTASGERTIFHRRATDLRWKLNRNGNLAEALASSDVLLVDGYYPELAQEITAMAYANTLPVVADANPATADPAWMAKVTTLIAPRHFLVDGGFGERVEDALDYLHELGPTTALITLGGDGWVASDRQGRYSGRAFKVEVRDTVGAGDVFHGAYAYALAMHWPTPRCAEFASAVAALKCTQTGGRAGIPGLSQTLDFLHLHNPEEWPETALD